MSAPDAPDDLPADQLPPELEGLVTLHDDGDLTWTRTVPTPHRGLGAAVLGVPALGLLHGIVTLVASSTLGREPPLVPVAVGCVALVVLSNRYLSEHVEPVRVGREGITGRYGLPWAEGDTLELGGDLRDSTAWLDHVSGRGNRTRLQTWTGVTAFRERGWDVDSIRWFAQRIAAHARAPLHTTLPAEANWRGRDARRTAARQEAGRRIAPKFELYLQLPPEPPEEVWGFDHVEILVRAGVRVRVGPTDVITQGGRRIPMRGIGEVFPWFGEERQGKGSVLVGEVRALTPDGVTHLLRMTLQGGDASLVTGAATAIRDALTRTRGGTTRETGDVADVPQTLRTITARTEEGTR